MIKLPEIGDYYSIGEDKMKIVFVLKKEFPTYYVIDIIEDRGYKSLKLLETKTTISKDAFIKEGVTYEPVLQGLDMVKNFLNE